MLKVVTPLEVGVRQRSFYHLDSVCLACIGQTGCGNEEGVPEDQIAPLERDEAAVAAEHVFHWLVCSAENRVNRRDGVDFGFAFTEVFSGKGADLTGDVCAMLGESTGGLGQ